MRPCLHQFEILHNKKFASEQKKLNQNGQMDRNGPEWTEMDLNGPKWINGRFI